MKKSTPVISVILLIILFLSCSKEENNTENTESDGINKKWIVENSDEFESIEFDNNGNYIITKNANNPAFENKLSKEQKTAEEIIVFGTYEILDSDIFCFQILEQ